MWQIFWHSAQLFLADAQRGNRTGRSRALPGNKDDPAGQPRRDRLRRAAAVFHQPICGKCLARLGRRLRIR